MPAVTRAASAGGTRSSERATCFRNQAAMSPSRWACRSRDVAVGGEQVEALPPSLRHPLERVEEGGKALRERESPVHGCVERLLDLGRDQLEEAREDLLLALEVPVERGGGVAGVLGQLGERRGGVPAPGENPGCRLEDVAAGALVGALAASRGGSSGHSRP